MEFLMKMFDCNRMSVKYIDNIIIYNKQQQSKIVDKPIPEPVMSQFFDQGPVSLMISQHNSNLMEVKFLSEASFGLWLLLLPVSVSVCVSVCLSVCVSVNPELVRTITHYTFKLEPPNLDKRCKTTWLMSLLLGLGGDWPWPSRSNLTWKAQFTPFELVHAITHHPCARTHSVAIDLITSKVRYCLWITANIRVAHGYAN